MKEVLYLHQFITKIGSFPIRSYSLIFFLAIILGLGVTITLARLNKKERLIGHLMKLAPFLFTGGIIGARFWQVFLFDWRFYSRNPAEKIAHLAWRSIYSGRIELR